MLEQRSMLETLYEGFRLLFRSQFHQHYLKPKLSHRKAAQLTFVHENYSKFFGEIDTMGRFHQHFCAAFSLEKFDAFFLANCLVKSTPDGEFRRLKLGL